MQDVLPPNQDPRSIRNIPVPPSRRHLAQPSEQIDSYLGETPRRRKGHSPLFWIGSVGFILLCAVGGVLLSTVFSGATVKVHPRQASVTLPLTLPAGLDAPVGQLSYQLVAISESVTRTVTSSGETNTTTPAQGTITIFNAYSTSSQKLVATTRFESASGKIYRIHEAVTVPGATRKADGTLNPGSVQATVYADQGGEGYNTGAGRLTIPGFKNDPRYSKFYAETTGIGGGASGARPNVSAADLSNAKKDMESELSEDLSSSITSKTPEGFAPIAGTFAPTYGTISITSGGEGKALLTEAATGTIAVVRTADLASIVAKAGVSGYGGEAVNFLNPKDISITATGTPATTSQKSLILAFSGSSPLVWQYDPEALKKALVGKNKGEFDSVASTFAPAIAEATASLRPFWKTVFPADPAKITVETVSK